MENPFAKLVNSEEVSETLDSTREEPMSPDERAKRIAELKEWKAQVEDGSKMEHHPDDEAQIEKIDEMIWKLEHEQ